jgi:hypothetical protein
MPSLPKFGKNLMNPTPEVQTVCIYGATYSPLCINLTYLKGKKRSPNIWVFWLNTKQLI